MRVLVDDHLLFIEGLRMYLMHLDPSTPAPSASSPRNNAAIRRIFFMLLRRRLTDRMGENEYLTYPGITRHWRFPTLFAHGSDNRVFDVRSAVQSWTRMNMVQAMGGKPKSAGIFVPEGFPVRQGRAHAGVPLAHRLPAGTGEIPECRAGHATDARWTRTNSMPVRAFRAVREAAGW